MDLVAGTHRPKPDPARTAAVARLYDDHAAAIHRYASRRVGRELAPDVVGDVFAIAIDRYEQFDPERGSGSAWLFGIANNVLRRHWRTEQRRLESLVRARLVAAGADPLASVDDRLDAESALERIVRLVIEMPDADRELLLLIAWERLSHDEVAAILDIPTGTVRSRLHRIRQQLDTRVRRTP